MVTFYNPALKEEALNEPARILWRGENESILNLLRRTNRIKSHESDKSDDHKLSEDLEDILGISISHSEEE